MENLKYKGRELDISEGDWMLIEPSQKREHEKLYLGKLSSIHGNDAYFNPGMMIHSPIVSDGTFIPAIVPVGRDGVNNRYSSSGVSQFWTRPEEIIGVFSRGWEGNGKIYVPIVKRLVSTESDKIISLDDLDLSVRASIGLRAAGIVDVEQLTRWTKRDFFSNTRLGRTSAREVEKRLGEYGLSFKEEEPRTQTE